MIRRQKVDVLSELPDKTRYKQEIGIDSEQYKEEVQKIFAQIEVAKDNVNNASKDERKTKVFQLNAMYQKALSSERQSAGIAKAPFVVKYVKDLMELEEKIVVFCHHRIVHEILMNGLKDYHPLHIIGGQTDNQRQDAIDTFQNTPVDEVMEWNKRNLLIAGIRAGNVGINLTAASYVIFAELDWSPAIHRQAEDRLHRIGQKKAVFAHYLVGEETLDETIVNVLVDKSLEIDGIMGDEHQDYDQEKAQVILEKLHLKLLKIKGK
jgi:SNF2 family DNA or RNA helicase